MVQQRKVFPNTYHSVYYQRHRSRRCHIRSHRKRRIVAVTPEEIVAALGRSRDFREGTGEFRAFAPFVGHLINVVHEVGETLDSFVRVETMCLVSCTYLRWLAANPDFLSSFADPSIVRESYLRRAASHEKLAGIIAQVARTESSYDEYEIFASSETSMQLDEESQLLFVSGQLTFGALLVTCPSALLP